MGVDQLPGRVREFANYLNGLLARLDQGAGWCAVFWQRDPDGMQACLDGREMPPWDVVEAVLQDLAAEYGTPAAAQEADRARSLHAAALLAYDARPGGREALGDRLDVMLREQRYAAERQAELGRLLGAAATQEEAEAIRLDLAWAHDDHERAVARCAELRHRMTEWERRAGEARITDADAVRRPSSTYGSTPSYGGGSGNGGGSDARGVRGAQGGPAAPGHGTQAETPRQDPRRVGEPAPGPGGHPRETEATQASGGHLRSEAAQASGGHAQFEAAQASGGHAQFEAAQDAGGHLYAEAAQAPGGHLYAEAAQNPGGHLRSEAAEAPGGHLHAEAMSAPGGYPRAEAVPVPGTSGYGVGAAAGSPDPAREGEPSAGGRGAARPAAGSPSAFAPAFPSAFDPAPDSVFGPAPAAPSAPTSTSVFDSVSVFEPAPRRGSAHQGTGDLTPGEEAEPAPDRSVQAVPEPEKGAKQKKRRRGSARFAGMAQEEGDAVVVPPSAAPVASEPAPAARRALRGARFAGAAARAERREEPQREPLDAEARRETVRAVERLVGLRGEGRSGEAHALLVELAYWPAARIPLLAAELQRAGLSADWTTLLWEAASLPADRLIEAADALVAVGRAADGEQILRQGVARPAEEIGEAVRGLHTGGRHREARALLDAYVRVRTPEEAARSAAPDPRTLVPLLLEAARGVSEQRRWDLVHALRVAGFSA
ncbi:hypothetical protein ABZ490_15420 [Streptomyces sp. NPDC005811]|uniref:hypothetical protein n=1 Tax=Streptomyces sp. NPDC005811 TaxID=3154565 RepID=UPI0034013204